MRWQTKAWRASYVDKDAFARDLHLGGGPSIEDIDAVGSSVGPSSDLHRAIWGDGNFDDILRKEQEAEQKQRPHVFVRKWRG